ncbi:MAG: hypothetical protein CMQ16_07785 [Gammaproteobacteria bacterium]|nr:hypothetical protein [Gammaproteobacteria bacterium]
MFVITCRQAYRDLIHPRVQHKAEPKLGANASVDRTMSRNSDRLELVFLLFSNQNNGGEPKNTVVYTQTARFQKQKRREKENKK